MNKEEAEKLREKLLEQINKLPSEQVSGIKKQIQDASAEQLESFVKKQMQAQGQKGNECFFCQFVSGKIETIKIYEDADILAILDIYPANPGQLIVLPKEHFQFMHEIPNFLLNKIFIFIKVIEPLLFEVTKAKALSIYIAQGLEAGQKVPHFSINIVPRFENDNIGFEWQKKEIDKKELEKIAQKLRGKAEKVVREQFEQERKKQEEKKKKEEASEAEKLMKHIKPRIP